MLQWMMMLDCHHAEEQLLSCWGGGSQVETSSCYVLTCTYYTSQGPCKISEVFILWICCLTVLRLILMCLIAWMYEWVHAQ